MHYECMKLRSCMVKCYWEFWGCLCSFFRKKFFLSNSFNSQNCHFTLNRLHTCLLLIKCKYRKTYLSWFQAVLLWLSFTFHEIFRKKSLWNLVSMVLPKITVILPRKSSFDRAMKEIYEIHFDPFKSWPVEKFKLKT